LLEQLLGKKEANMVQASSMDIPRVSNIRAKRIRLLVYAAIAFVLVSGVTYTVLHLRPAAPSVDKGSIWTDEVKRGPMVREIRGSGSLVPEEIRWITAQTDARVDRIVIHPGATVHPDTIILELTNQEVQRELQDAEYQLKGAQADLESLKAQLNGELLKQKAEAATTRSQYAQAKLQSDVDEQFRIEGLGSDLTAKLSKGKVEQLAIQLQVEEETIKSAADSTKSRLSASQSKVDQQRSMYELKRSKLDALHVRAGIEGVLQQVPVEVGQQVGAGTNVARVTDPKKLKAEIAIAETQAKDVVLGQKVSIDTHNGIAEGRVTRIDPSVINGTVTVDAEITDPLPKGTRPDTGVEGAIELDNLRDVLFVARPVRAQSGSTIGLFKVADDGVSAVRLNVKLGRSSADTIEVVEGLKTGDKVILSDMSAWDGFDRIKLK
jgi:HlyD family secretion protein